MVAWLGVGLGAIAWAAITAVMWRDWRAIRGMEKRWSSVERQLADISRRPPKQRAVLDQTERLELQAVWGHLVCTSCGTLHPGLCPRVKRQKIERAQGKELVDTEYWSNDKWGPPDTALSAEDVFGSVAAAAQETMEQTKKASEV